MVATKKAQGTARTVTEAMSAISRGLPEMDENPIRTMIPADTITIGIKTAQRIPMID